MSVLSHYLRSGVAAILAKGLNAAAMIAVLSLLNRVMPKDVFGLFMLALTVVTIVASILSSSFNSLQLYRIARLDQGDTSTARRMNGACILYGGVLGVIVAGVIGFGAELIASLFRKPDLAIWLQAVALYIPVNALLRTVTSGIKAQQEVVRATLYQDVWPTLLRLLCVLAVWACGLRPEWAAAAYILPEFLPALVLAVHTRPVFCRWRSVFTKDDTAYASKMLLTNLVDNPNKSIDTLMIGLLASPVVVANYVVATKLARLMLVLKNAAAQLLSVRIAHNLAREDQSALNTEYNWARLVTTIAGAGGLLGFLLLGEWLLSLIGDYREAWPLLAILSAAMLVRAGVGTIGNYLVMAGYAGWTFMNSALSLAMNTLGAAALYPLFAENGVALATWIAVSALNAVGSILAYRKDSFVAVPPVSIAVLLGYSAVAIAAAWGILAYWLAALMVAGLGLVQLYAERKLWLPFVRSCLQGRLSRD